MPDYSWADDSLLDYLARSASPLWATTDINTSNLFLDAATETTPAHDNSFEEDLLDNFSTTFDDGDFDMTTPHPSMESRTFETSQTNDFTEYELEVGFVGRSVQKRVRSRLSRKQTDILNQWLLQHDEPYPTRGDKSTLSKQTGLTVNQISFWFARTRQRKLQRVNTHANHLSLSSGAFPQYSQPRKALQASMNFLKSCPSNKSLPHTKVPFAKDNSRRPRAQSLPVRYPLKYLVQHEIFKSGYNHPNRVSMDVAPSQENEPSLELPDNTNKLYDYDLRQDVEFKTAFIMDWLMNMTENDQALTSKNTFTYHTKTASGEFAGWAVEPDIHRFDWMQHLTKCKRRLFRALRSVQLDEDKERDEPKLHPYQIRRSRLEDLFDLPHRQPSEVSSNAPSNARSGSPAGSYMSFGSRKGRRQSFTRMPRSRGNSVGRVANVDQSTGWKSPETVEAASGLEGQESWPAELKNESREVPRSARSSSSRDSKSPPSVDTNNFKVPKRRPYQCTYCLSRFGTPFAWKRHEESTHMPQKQWICGPLEQSSVIVCPLCPVNTDVCLHGFDKCWAKPKESRTFFRRDALKQHFSVVHRYSNEPLPGGRAAFDAWSEPVDSNAYDLTCHFCGHVNQDWDQRAKHIIAHFKEGMTMDDWRKAKRTRSSWQWDTDFTFGGLGVDGH